ncbi:MAG: hypothetical protein NTY19_44450 [Planctomycetota bacterium]|nr:hypothetical protein [Planctomycetota bacterium]
MPWRDPYNPFDSHISEWGGFCDPTSSGPRPSLNRALILEGLRQGIQDHRYLAMFERLPREHATTPASRAAEEYLRCVREEVQPQADYCFRTVITSWRLQRAWHRKVRRSARCWST